MLVNAVLFVRPNEVFSALVGVEVYQYVILVCALVCIPVFIEYLSPKLWEERPIAVCVAMLLPAIVLSVLARLAWVEVGERFEEFGKVLVYFVLFLGVVRTPGRLRWLCAALAVFSAAATSLALLDYHGVLELFRAVATKKLDEADALPPHLQPLAVLERRMDGTGLFQDPNDLCMLIVMGLVLSLGPLTDRRQGGLRLLWLLLLPIFAYGFYQTRSRGGMMALLAGVGLFVRLRYGWRAAIGLALIGLPLLVLSGGRQVELNVRADTAQDRMGLWAEGITMFRSSPVFGIGAKHFTDHASHVAHNSYIQVFAELGLLGAVFFVGAFYLAAWGLYRLVLPRPVGPGPNAEWRRPVILDGELADVYPSLAGAVAAWTAGMFTLTLCYILPTYTMLGLAAVFLGLVRTDPPVPGERFELTLLLRLAAVAFGVLVFIFLFVRVFLGV